jgi:hypothetical protein
MKLIENCTTAAREREKERDRLQRVIKNRAVEGGCRRAEGSRSDEVRETERERNLPLLSPHTAPSPIAPYKYLGLV